MSTSVKSDITFTDPRSFVAAARPAIDSGSSLQLQIGDLSLKVDAEFANRVLAIVDAAIAGRAIEVTILEDELTTGQAADLLGVTRPTVVAMIDKGLLPAQRVSTHRKLKTSDVLAFRERVRGERAKAVGEMADISGELGLYND